MQSISVVTSQNVKIKYKVASVGDRIIATIIDMLIVYSYLFLIGMLLLENPPRNNWVPILAILPYAFYHLICELTLDGQSVGKKAMSLKVVAMDGSRPSLGMYLTRWLLRLIEIFPGFGIIAMIIVIVSNKGQRLGDILAGTSVIKLTSTHLYREAIAHNFNEKHEVTYPESMRLSDEDFSIIEKTLAYCKKENNTGPASLLAEKLSAKMGIAKPSENLEFLEIVKNDYHHLTSHY